MLQELPKISVITVCLNAEKVIGKTIKSVLGQSYSNLEYIVIDGGSADETKEIVRTFGGKINCFVSEKDSGIYDAMNKGIRNATGDLLIFLNAGDYYISSNVLSYAISKMRLNRADVFFARFIWEDISRHDIVLSDHASTQFDWDLKRSNFPHPATFYKRTIFDRIGDFNVTYKILGDYEWNTKALIKHRIAFQYINIIIAFFSTDGMSNDNRNKKLIEAETNKIANQYFQPLWLFDFLLKYSHSNFSKKLIAKVFSKRLNRI
ncbi:glycosyltransferase family 2 protein [Segetibacter sp.]|uniref:glycosyltransferase family 2 protein n=1 Tax=Segetibacter sp. TaxID=2231182 RepID=UPI002619642F|nr:glycosyltransferase family 2 protein [Segetibacter sp.]MCW3079614.1 glycosyltransferase involved in cell wall biosis [Segetibacter sp.]